MFKVGDYVKLKEGLSLGDSNWRIGEVTMVHSSGTVGLGTNEHGLPNIYVNPECIELIDYKPYSEIKETKGTKHDDSKPSLEYIPMEAMWAMGYAFKHGAKKYGGNNYKKGLEVTRCLAAALRHIFLFLAGENNDSESGHSHLGHALAAVAMAVYMLANKPEMDDRYKP